jgi:enoyl-CoA hydratase/carnithine racemase
MTQQSSAPPLILEERHGPIVTLRLHRPDALNALSRAMLGELERALTRLAADDDLRCVILAGSGRAFCAGHDLAEMQALRSVQAARELFDLCSRVMLAVRALPVPVIARVQGIATAAGCQLVATCDLAIAADTAKLAVSGINVGLFCSTPAVALSRNVSPKRAFDLLATGRFIDARTACEYGLINEAVAESELDAAVERKAEEIARKSGSAMRLGKALFYRQQRLDVADAYAEAAEVMARNLMEPDAARGIERFLTSRSR